MVRFWWLYTGEQVIEDALKQGDILSEELGQVGVSQGVDEDVRLLPLRQPDVHHVGPGGDRGTVEMDAYD